MEVLCIPHCWGGLFDFGVVFFFVNAELTAFLMARGDALAAVEELRVTKIRLLIFVLLFIFSSAFNVNIAVNFIDF